MNMRLVEDFDRLVETHGVASHTIRTATQKLGLVSKELDDYTMMAITMTVSRVRSSNKATLPPPPPPPLPELSDQEALQYYIRELYKHNLPEKYVEELFSKVTDVKYQCSISLDLIVFPMYITGDKGVKIYFEAQHVAIAVMLNNKNPNTGCKCTLADVYADQDRHMQVKWILECPALQGMKEVKERQSYFHENIRQALQVEWATIFYREVEPRRKPNETFQDCVKRDAAANKLYSDILEQQTQHTAFYGPTMMPDGAGGMIEDSSWEIDDFILRLDSKM